jgi:hypothetical protein
VPLPCSVITCAMSTYSAVSISDARLASRSVIGACPGRGAHRRRSGSKPHQPLCRPSRTETIVLLRQHSPLDRMCRTIGTHDGVGRTWRRLRSEEVITGRGRGTPASCRYHFAGLLDRSRLSGESRSLSGHGAVPSSRQDGGGPTPGLWAVRGPQADYMDDWGGRYGSAGRG